MSDTLAWFPTPYTMPGHSPLEQLTAAVQDLVHAVSTVTKVEQHMLLKDASTGTLALGPTLMESVTRLQELFAPAVATDRNVSGATEPSPLTPACGPTLPAHTPSEFQRVPTDALSEPITVSDVSAPSHAPVYVWEPARHRDAPTKRAARYFTFISKFFRDDQGTQKIVGVERKRARSSGPGSRTLFL